MKFTYFILLTMLFVSCQKDKTIDTEKKQVAESALPADTNLQVPQDSSAQQEKTTTKDTSKENGYVKNILSAENKNAPTKVKSISALWKEYKNAKKMAAKYIEQNNLDSIIYYFNIAADVSYELNRNDIATWQLNNIGYYSINKFKEVTDYDIRMQKLSTMKNLREKALYVKETKTVFRENFNILETAQNYLYKAQLLDNELEPSERTEKIARNLQFIEWIERFISNGKFKSRSNN